jgi:branched-chain amino acid transport system substrate-binding protein
MPTSRPYKIGIAAPLSGEGAPLGREMTRAAGLAIVETSEVCNAAGVHLEANILDDAGDPQQGCKVAHRFAEDDAILAIIGHYNSNLTLMTAPFYLEAGLPLVAPIVSNPNLTESGWSNVFRFTNRDDNTAAAIARYLRDERHKSRAIVVETETVYGSSMSAQFIAAWQALGGTIIDHHRVSEGREDFVALVNGFPEEADLVFYGGTFEGAPLLKEMRTQRYMQLFAAGDGCWDIVNFLVPAGRSATEGEGVIVLSACPEIGKVAGSSDFAMRYERQFGPITNYAVNSFDAAMTVVEAVCAAARHNALARAGVWEHLRSTRRTGIAYPRQIQWDSKGDNLAALTALHIVRDGHFHQIASI